MLKSLYWIVFSLLAFVACSGDNYATGTVDPNAGPQIAENDRSSSSSVTGEPDSKGDLSSSSAREVFLVRTECHGVVSVKEEEMVYVSFDYKASATYTIIERTEGAAVVNKGEIEVYSEEKGASASCKVDEKNYSTQFKIGQNNRVERSLKLENFGSGCDEIFEQFKNLCLLQNANDELSGACDDNGTLEAYCAYVDESAVFDTLLEDFSAESTTNCGDNSVHIDSFGI
ncbi:MAG: hypothetical protein SPL52_00410 [Fibrobacter sp.]|nr:hypothetical protein [Fibrobacter sp.]